MQRTKVFLFLRTTGSSCIICETGTRPGVPHIQATYKDFHSELRILKEALEKADDKIYSKGLSKYKCQMGTTIAAAIVTDFMIFYTWQGNVRIYHKHNGELKLLTIDHTLDIGYGQQRITRCLKGVGLRDDVPFLSAKLSRGDSLFFCTIHQGMNKSLHTQTLHVFHHLIFRPTSFGMPRL